MYNHTSLTITLIYNTQWQCLDYIMSVYRFTVCYNFSFMLCNHAIIVYSRCRIPNLHLIMCTCYLMVLFFYLVGHTFHFVLLKRHLKAALHFILFSVQILFICILSIRILFFSFAYFFHSYTFHLCPFFIRLLLIRILHNTHVFLWVLRNFQEFAICKGLLLIRISFM